jgi:hypothetical protein
VDVGTAPDSGARGGVGSRPTRVHADACVSR